MLTSNVGKCAPRLLEDLLDYDSRSLVKKTFNLLTDPAPQYKGEGISRTGPDDCRHFLAIKSHQSAAPASQTEQPTSGTEYVLATFCAKCRYHITMTVSFTAKGQSPCKQSSQDNPLHHFQHTASKSRYVGNDAFRTNNAYEIHKFECSGANCPCVVAIDITPPRLPQRLVKLFNNEQQLYQRGLRTIQAEPERYAGYSPLKPKMVFVFLRSYIVDAMTKARAAGTDRIQRRNKKYMLAFANECDELFEHLGFKAIEESEPEGVSIVLSIPLSSGSVARLALRNFELENGSYLGLLPVISMFQTS